MTAEHPADRTAKLWYPPVGWVGGLLAGEITGVAFQRWTGEWPGD